VPGNSRVKNRDGIKAPAREAGKRFVGLF
jgi:hypothetical protein